MNYQNLKWIAAVLITLTIWGCTKKVVNTSVTETEVKVVANVANQEWNKADSILALMTLSEKLGQLQQLDGGISRDDLPKLIEAGKVGSVLNEVNPEIVAKYQKVAMEKSRLGIPLLIGRDVIHGYRTIFPIPLGQSASWNTEIVEEGARIVLRAVDR